MKSNFDNMSKAELRAYVMSHRDDQEAFCKLIDRLKAESTIKYAILSQNL